MDTEVDDLPLITICPKPALKYVIRHICHCVIKQMLSRCLRDFLSDPGKPGVRSLGPYVREGGCVDLTDVTLAAEDTKS